MHKLCEKCGCKVFKPWEDGMLCTCCGLLRLDPITQTKVIDHEVKCVPARQGLVPTEKLASGANTEKSKRCRAYMRETYAKIEKLLKDGFSYHKISLILGDREACMDPKSLRNHFNQESARRGICPE